MEFSYLKSTSLRPKKEKYLSTFLIALAVAAAMFVPYMITSEGYFIFYGDFNVQQIPFYQECHQAVRSGNIFWNWNTDLGANFIGSYSFYLLGSPFFWLTLPFSNSFVPYLMGPLLILKFACAAFTGCMYIRRFTRTPEAARIGGLLYAFSGFSVYNIFFNHFHEAIIVFPLLLLSMELLLTENRRYFFALMVALSAIINYYFFFGMVVFCVIYFVVRMFSGAIRVTVKGFFVLIWEAVLGLMLSFALLLPALCAIMGNYRITEFLTGWDAIMYGKEQIYGNVLQCFFFPPDIPARPVFFPGADVKWSSLGGWLPLFSMVGVFTWFSQKKKTWLGRVIGICIFMSLVPILNSAFYAFNDSYYARWFFMPILMMCLATVCLTEDRTVNWKPGFKWVTGITLAVTLVIGFFPQKDSEGKITFGLFTDHTDPVYISRFWITCAIALTSLLVLGILLKFRKKGLKPFYNASLAGICIFSILYGNFFIATGRSHSYEIKNVMIDKAIESHVDLGDQSQFRVDVYDGIDNTSLYLGLPGINAFHSIVPEGIFQFYDFIGVERSVGSRPEVDDTALRSLLSVKYLLNRTDGQSFVDPNTEDTRMYGYEYVKTEGGYHIYENQNYIPYGFSYDYYMTEEFCESYGEKSRTSMMLKAIMLTDKQIEKYGYMFQNLSELNDEGAYGDKRISWEMSDATYEFDCDQRAKSAAYSFVTDNHGFTAKVQKDKETLVFFSVPFDEGWSATVNGQAAEIENVNSGFMAVKVPAGDSEIRFHYMTPGLLTGIKISVLTALVFLVYIIIFSVYHRKHSPEMIYPEGRELLKTWHSWEAEPETIDSHSPQPEPEPKPSLLDDLPDIDLSGYASFRGGFTVKTDFEDTDDKNEPPKD